MRHRIRVLNVGLTLALLSLPVEAWSKGFDPDRGKSWLEQALEDHRLDDPSITSNTTQNEAPSSSALSTAVVDRASFTTLIATALESLLGQGSDQQALTLSLNLFAMAAASDSSVLLDNDRYARYSGLRRLAGSVTLGGKADDSTGIEPGDRPRSLTDIVQVNAKWRMVGSRDRRDHWPDYRDLKLEDVEAALIKLTQLPGFAQRLTQVTTDAERYEIVMEAFEKHPELADKLQGTLGAYDRALVALNRKIDRQFVLSLNLTGDLRRTELGKDKFFAELVAEEGNLFELTGNLGFRSDEISDGEHDRELKLALAASKKIFRRSPMAEEGFDVSLGVSGQLRNRERASVWLANTKLVFPLQEGMGLSVSVTWASRSDLIDDHFVRGNFGLSYDFGAKKPKG